MKTVFDFFSLHFPDSGFDGRLQIGCKRADSSSLIPAMTFDYSNWNSALENFVFYRSMDYYVSVNSVSGVLRQCESLFSLHNFVIDLDCHDLEYSSSMGELCEDLLWRLEHDLFGTVITKPTSVVFTGRGLQLWWAIEGISGKFISFFRELLDFYILSIKECLNSSILDDFSMFQVDEVASKNVVGYFRIPGTTNTKVNTMVTYFSSGQRYVLMDLFHLMKEWKEDVAENETLDQSEGHKVKFLPVSDQLFFLEKRVSAIFKLRDLRDYEIGCEQRNNFTFMLYNSLVPYCGHVTSFEKLKGFNSGFKEPLTEHELNGVIVTAKKKGGYQYTHESFVDFFGITSEEAALIGFEADSLTRINKKGQNKVQVLVRKNARNAEILRLFQEGYSILKISRTLKVSAPTISKVLKENDRKVVSYTKEDILQLYHSGLKSKEIAEKYHCSDRTVRRVLASCS